MKVTITYGNGHHEVEECKSYHGNPVFLVLVKSPQDKRLVPLANITHIDVYDGPEAT